MSSPSLPNYPREKIVEEKSSLEMMFDELYAFKAQNGHCNVSQSDAGNKSLSHWVNNQRFLYKKNTLSSDRTEQLNSIGFIWDKRDHAWNEKFDQLCAFKAQNGHSNVSKYVTQTKFLGQWVVNQRVFYKRNTLTSDRIQQLDSIGFEWDPREVSWNEHFDQLCTFKTQNGHSNVSTLDTHNTSLGNWVRDQRASYKKNALSSNHIKQLDSLGFIWNFSDKSKAKENYRAEIMSWEQRFDELCAFKAQKRHCHVSQSDAGNKSLGHWVSQQRVSYTRNTLNSDRIQRLNSIGFAWDPREVSWNGSFYQLCAFKTQHGHCNASQHGPRYKSLSRWVSRQRMLYKRNALNSNYIQKINSIGFVWDPCKNVSRAKHIPGKT